MGILYAYVQGRLLCNGYLLAIILYCVYYVLIAFSHTSMSLPSIIILYFYFKYLAYYSYITQEFESAFLVKISQSQ